MTADPFLANGVGGTPNSWQLGKNRLFTQQWANRSEAQQVDLQPNAWALVLVDLWQPQRKEFSWTQSGRRLSGVNWNFMSPPLAGTQLEVSAAKIRDSRERLSYWAGSFRSIMPNVDWNLDLEYPNLLVPVSPLSCEANQTMPPMAVSAFLWKETDSQT